MTPNERLALNERLTRIERLLAMQTTQAINVKDAALLLHLSESRIRHLVCERAIPHYRTPSGGISFRRDELEQWMLATPVPTAAEIAARAATYCALHPRR